MKISGCPNESCRYHRKTQRGFYAKKGYYVTKWNAQPVPRYRCLGCGRSFSSHTFRRTYRQKKPYLNEDVLGWYASGTTQRPIARVMGINRKTVVRKFLFLASLAKERHQEEVRKPAFRSLKVQFDEMETFEHTRLKPLSIAIAVNAESGAILAAEVASMPAKGKLAVIARKKYGTRFDHRPRARRKALAQVALVSPIELTTDRHPSYPRLIKTFLPRVTHTAVKSRGEIRFLSQRSRRRNPRDALFTLNYTFAKLRHDLSRLARKVWVTTKRASRLQAHLDLYIAFNNGYLLATGR